MAGFNHYSQIAAALPEVLSQIVRKAALDTQAHVQEHIRANGQIDTSFMINSVYTVTDKGSTYGQIPAPPKGAKLLPEISEQANKTTAWVAIGASYSVNQNYGTRFLPARPFWEPGIEDTRPGLEAALSAVEKKLKEAI